MAFKGLSPFYMQKIRDSYDERQGGWCCRMEDKNVCVQLAQAVKEHWEELEESKDTKHGQQPELEQDIF